MTNSDLGYAYFEQAKSIRGEMDYHVQKKEWHLVVRRGQEVVELILKGFLRLSSIEVPYTHDVGTVLEKEKEKLSSEMQSHVPRIVSVSRRLRLERETSFYGDEELELPASELYTEVDSQQTFQDVDWLIALIPSVKPSGILT